MKVTIAKWGNSKAVRLPKSLTEAQGLKEGTQLELTVDARGFHFSRPGKSSKELLAEMLQEAKRLGPEFEPETLDWGLDRGSEIIDDNDPR